MEGGHVNKTKLSMGKLYILKLNYGHIGVCSTILSTFIGLKFSPIIRENKKNTMFKSQIATRL